MKKERDFSGILMGLLSFILGGLLICATEDLITGFNYILVCIFSIIGIIEVINFFMSKDYVKNYYNNIIIGITFIWLALVFYKYYMIIINILPILFSLYLFMMGVVLIIKYNLLKISMGTKYKVYVVMGILAFIVGVFLVFEPIWSVYIYLKLTGIYIVLLSILFFYEYFKKLDVKKED